MNHENDKNGDFIMKKLFILACIFLSIGSVSASELSLEAPRNVKATRIQGTSRIRDISRLRTARRTEAWYKHAPALWIAAYQADVSRVKELIQAGADVNKPETYMDTTPLVAAAKKAFMHLPNGELNPEYGARVQIVRLLLNAGAYPFLTPFERFELRETDEIVIAMIAQTLNLCRARI